ncbi:MAG: hypothetical protein AAFU78_06115 [Cyanobacteria bacterium J06633_2]
MTHLNVAINVPTDEVTEQNLRKFAVLSAFLAMVASSAVTIPTMRQLY